VLSDLGMGGGAVVKQGGRKKGSKLHGGKDGCQKQPDSERGGRLLGAIEGVRVFRHRWVGHRNKDSRGEQWTVDSEQ
jgi:hypothetical protein